MSKPVKDDKYWSVDNARLYLEAAQSSLAGAARYTLKDHPRKNRVATLAQRCLRLQKDVQLLVDELREVK